MKRKVNVVRTYSQDISNITVLKRAFVSQKYTAIFEQNKSFVA